MKKIILYNIITPVNIGTKQIIACASLYQIHLLPYFSELTFLEVYIHMSFQIEATMTSG